MSKYNPLNDYLSTIEPTFKETTLKFSEIEKILGFKLPKSANQYREWWANPNTRDHPHAQSWLKAGWQVDTVDSQFKWVRFRRPR